MTLIETQTGANPMQHFKTKAMADQVATVARKLGKRAVVIKTANGFTVLHTV